MTQLTARQSRAARNSARYTAITHAKLSEFLDATKLVLKLSYGDSINTKLYYFDTNSLACPLDVKFGYDGKLDAVYCCLPDSSVIFGSAMESYLLGYYKAIAPITTQKPKNVHLAMVSN